MTTEMDRARDDLAYMRSLVSGTAEMQASVGKAFLAAGVIYGLQCVGHWFQELGILPWDGLWGLGISLGPTVLFIIILFVIFWEERNRPKPTGVGARAVGAVFQGAGLANLVMAFVFGYGAYKTQNMTIWFYHPIVVCMFQAVAWFVVWQIMRRTWLAFVSLGWFVTTATLGIVINSSPYVLVIAVALFLLMAIPGYVMMRAGKKPA